MRQKSLSHICPSFWKKLLDSLKRNITLNMFKHDIERHYLEKLKMQYLY